MKGANTMTFSPIRWKRQVPLGLLVLCAWFSDPSGAVADPVKEYDALDVKMAETQEAYSEAKEALSKGKGSADEVNKLADLRLAIIRRMDTHARDASKSPGGEHVAFGAFDWSWNLDLDLDSLVDRFELLVGYHADADEMHTLLEMVAFIGAEVGSSDRWTKALAALAKRTKRDETKYKSLMAIGQIELLTGQLPKAKATYESVIKLAPKSDYASNAKRAIFEIEHLQVGMVAPDFVIKSLDGKDIALKSLRGKAVLLNFWTTW